MVQPESLFDRIQQYRKKLWETTAEENQLFKYAVSQGKFPTKCLRCFQAGIRFCRFWESMPGCEFFDREQIAEKIEQLL